MALILTDGFTGAKNDPWDASKWSTSNVGNADVLIDPVFSPTVTSEGVLAATWDTETLQAPVASYVRPIQRTFWYNSSAGRWDGILPLSGGGDDWHLVKDIFGTPASHLVVDTRATSRPNVIWDDAGNRLYMSFSHGTAPFASTVDYTPGTDTYAFGAVNKVTMPTGLTTGQNDTQPMAYYRDEGGRIWAAVKKVNILNVAYSTDSGATWSGVVDLDAGTSAVGQVGFGEFTNAATDYIYVFAAEDAGGGYWALYIDRTATDISAGNWTDDSANLPTPSGSGSDDHIDMVSYNDTIYIVTKSELPTGTDPRIMLWVRAPGGTFAEHVVWTENDAVAASQTPTRPALTINTASQDLLVFWENENSAQSGKYRWAPLSNLSDITSASNDTVSVTDTASTNLESPVTPSFVDAVSGIGYLIYDGQGNRFYWYTAEVRSEGRLRVSASTTQAQAIASMSAVGTQELLTKVRFTATGNTQFIVTLRGSGTWAANGFYPVNGYIVRKDFDSSTATIREVVNESPNSLGSFTWPVDTNERWLRFQAEGTNLRAKIWLTTESEPGAWNLEVTDASFATGVLQLSLRGASSFAYVDDLTLDDLQGAGPQDTITWVFDLSRGG